MDSTQTDGERQQLLLEITKRLFLFTSVCLIVVAISFFIFISIFENRTYVTLIIFGSGIIGGFLSIQQRLPKAKLNELKELKESWTSLLLIPLNGGIFALLLHILFLRGILQGSLFPSYYIPEFDLNNVNLDFQAFLLNTLPRSGPDIAKLVFWSLVAGFSERFVPQIIRQTVKNVSDK